MWNYLDGWCFSLLPRSLILPTFSTLSSLFYQYTCICLQESVQYVNVILAVASKIIDCLINIREWFRVWNCSRIIEFDCTTELKQRRNRKRFREQLADSRLLITTTWLSNLQKCIIENSNSYYKTA